MAPLDRFSFMVKRSLTKINPTLIPSSSGSVLSTDSLTNLFTDALSGFSGNLDTLSLHYSTLSDTVHDLSGSMSDLSHSAENAILATRAFSSSLDTITAQLQNLEILSANLPTRE